MPIPKNPDEVVPMRGVIGCFPVRMPGSGGFRFYVLTFTFLLGTALPLFADMPVVHHEIKVSVYPDKGTFEATDTLRLPPDFPRTLDFFLHAGLDPRMEEGGTNLRKASGLADLPDHVERYSVKRIPGSEKLRFRYGGSLVHPFESVGPETARGMQQTAGTISTEGVYLTGASYWYPHIAGLLVTASIHVRLPEGWISVSQGPSPEQFRREQSWEIRAPQDELFLMAYRFRVYRKQAGRIRAEVYLRESDDSLANRYLEATAGYLGMYEKLIGPYPYSKFALVENFWETGYGMPSFTLLGPKVIRMPFILYSSYPHEILHNWWGNGVYPDWQSGNWSEGLTAYLADHLIKEQQGQSVDYRQATLQKYADYVTSGRDFPLTGFTSRHSSSSEAIGYGKSLMFFHMLRRELGDAVFVKGLQCFYRDFRFKSASYDDLRSSFESESGRKLRGFFDQWTTRSGAPYLKTAEAQVTQEKGGYRLHALVSQAQEGRPYLFTVPVWITLEGEPDAREHPVTFSGREAVLDVLLENRPLRVDIDPDYDVFRRLDHNEIPPAISQVLGAHKMTVILPDGESSEMLSAYKVIAEGLSHSGPDEVEVLPEGRIKQMPHEGSVVVLGYRNRWMEAFEASLSGYPFSRSAKAVQVERTQTAIKGHAFVLASRMAGRQGQGLLWIALDDPDAAPGLARKLPHYHKYSYLGFEGTEPENILKGRWPVLRSPMTLLLTTTNDRTEGVVPARRPPQRPLVEKPSEFSEDRMLETIRYLTSAGLGGRGYEGDALGSTSEYIRDRFAAAGLEPAGLHGYYQEWPSELEPRGDSFPKRMVLRNVLGRIPGTNPRFDGEAVVIGAHYDHLGMGWPDVRSGESGKHHPGADDNASGVAVLLELAETFREWRPERTLVFVAFTGEEIGRAGSRYYVSSSLAVPPEKCMAMINLDTVGRLGDGKLMVLGGGSAREWVHLFRGVGYVTGVDIQMVAEPLDSSDHTSFHAAGIPAVQLFAGAHPDYHTPRDTLDKIDGEGLLRVASVAREAVTYLAGRDTPLEVTLGGAERGSGGGNSKGERKVTLGTIPDFAFAEKGCRLSGVVPGSPAESCGLVAGDVIVRIKGEPVDDLRSMSRVLKTLNPGDRVTITYIRDGREMTVDAEVAAR